MFRDGQCPQVAPDHAEKRELAVRHGMKQVPELTLLAVINGGQRSPEGFQHHFQVVQAPPELRHPTYRGTACKAPDKR